VNPLEKLIMIVIFIFVFGGIWQFLNHAKTIFDTIFTTSSDILSLYGTAIFVIPTFVIILIIAVAVFKSREVSKQ